MKPTSPIRIIIDNLPSGTPWYQIWIPIIIAIGSIFIPGFSIYYARKTFELTTRPYIWAVNYGYMQDNIVRPNPSMVMLICKAYPAKVSFTISITLRDRELFKYSKSDDIQFPDGSEWSYGINESEYNTLMNRPVAEQSLLQRIIKITYSDLDGNKEYKSVVKQMFIPVNNQWRTTNSEAN